MASLLHKLLKKQSVKSIITTFNKKPQFPNLIPTLLTHVETGDSISPRSPPIFPSFPFGFSLNPISSTGLVPSAGGGDAPTIWADSVKKKRKKKMNKHKYKKLKKRLRHQS